MENNVDKEPQLPANIVLDSDEIEAGDGGKLSVLKLCGPVTMEDIVDATNNTGKTVVLDSYRQEYDITAEKNGTVTDYTAGIDLILESMISIRAGYLFRIDDNIKKIRNKTEKVQKVIINQYFTKMILLAQSMLSDEEIATINNYSERVISIFRTLNLENGTNSNFLDKYRGLIIPFLKDSGIYDKLIEVSDDGE